MRGATDNLVDLTQVYGPRLTPFFPVSISGEEEIKISPCKIIVMITFIDLSNKQ